MRQRKGLGLGSVSLVLVFAVLCLTIFALLTLSTARSDANLAERAADSAKSYYLADTEAERVYVALADALENGEKPETVRDTEITYNGDYASYLCSIDGGRSIAVTLVSDGTGGGTRIMQWRETEDENWMPDEQIEVWTGQ